MNKVRLFFLLLPLIRFFRKMKKGSKKAAKRVG